ncbi:MAG: DUF5658 family protein [Planctomycetota bacterium]
MSDSSASPTSSASPFHPPTPAELGRRRRTDRRSAPTPRISEFSLFGGRRRVVQRKEELEGSFIDMYSTLMLVWVMWVSLMNLGDSFFTLVHLQAGGIEVNPVADALLRTGRFGFVFAKGALIGGALLVLTMHKNFWLARTGLWISTVAYTALVIYHLTLF